MKEPNYPNFSDTTHTPIKRAIDNQFHYQNCSVADKPIVIINIHNSFRNGRALMRIIAHWCIMRPK